MTALVIGSVVSVHDERPGGEIVSSSGTTLILDDTGDFNEDGGQLVDSTGAILGYGTADHDASTLILLAPASLTAGDWVAPWSKDHEDAERLADVDTGDGPPVVSVVPHALRTLLRPGIRGVGEREIVTIWEPVIGQVQVLNILGVLPALVGPSIDVPDVNEDGFHVDSDGNWALGGPTAIRGRIRWRISALEIFADPDDANAVLRLDEPNAELAAGVGGASAVDVHLRRAGPQTWDIDNDAADGGGLDWGGGAGGGKSRLAIHDYIELAARTTDPGAGPAGSIRVYSKIVAGVSKAFIQDDASGVHAVW